MNEQVWKSPYDIEVSELCVVNQPRSVKLIISGGKAVSELTLINPKPLTPLLESLDDCWEILISDRNIKENNQLNFGRFLVEIKDEDNVIGCVLCDEYTIEEVQS